MNFIANLWSILNSPADEAVDRIYHSKSKQWVAQFAPQKSAPQFETAAQSPLMPNENYITVTAQKTVLPYDRVLLKTFYGVVHSTIIVHDDVGDPRSITTFDSMDPTLTAIDKRAGGKMVQGPRTLLEFVPFRGTAIRTTIALLAVEAANYAKPLLLTLQKMSSIAGVMFFSAAAVFAEPLISGVQALSEVAGVGGTQIVYLGNLPLHTGIFLIAATDAAQFDWSDYSLASDYTLLNNGSPVDAFAYMVLTIEASDNRPDWMQIPELRNAATALNTAVRAAESKIADPASVERVKVENALLTFAWACFNTPELCQSDGKRIAALAKEKIDRLIEFANAGLGAPASARKLISPVEPGFSLEDLQPFPRPKSGLST